MSGGGDAPGVNAILRGFVHAASRFKIEVLGSRYGFEGLLAHDGIVPLHLQDVRGILPKGGSALGCSTRVNPFFLPVATPGSGERATRDMGPAIVDRLRTLGIEGLVLIAGDGTQLGAQHLVRLGMPCLCIPKTIDNDLGDNDATCGFETAVDTVTHAIDSLHATAEAHARVMVLEVMGRNAGFIALQAGVAGGADVVLIPEVPYRLERVLAKIRERELLGLRFSIVVISEGARPAGGTALHVSGARPGILPRLGGAGARLVQELENSNIEHEVRLVVLGHLQRGGSPSSFDRALGTQLGALGAELCRDGVYGKRVVFQGGRFMTMPLPTGDEKSQHRQLDVHGPLARAARHVGIELGD